MGQKYLGNSELGDRRSGIKIGPETQTDLLFIIVAGILILAAIGILLNTDPMGDDALLHIADIRSFARNFPYVAWDPYSFNGYSPIIGFPWTVFLPIAAISAAGLNVVFVFHVAFVVNFLMLGLSIYYFATRIKAHRLVSLALPILIWSTNTYWNYTIWGAAYTRAFALPFVFATLGLTYDYISSVNQGKVARRKYWIAVLLWFLTLLTDVYVAIICVSIGSIFLLFSAGKSNLRVGIIRLAKILLPSVGLTLWYFIPLAQQTLSISPLRNDLTPNQVPQLFVNGPQSTSSLNIVYVPSVLTFTFVAVIVFLKRKGIVSRLRNEQKALIISLSIVSVYFFIMGWIPQLWPYLPRLMSAYDSNNILSVTFIMILAIISGWYLQAQLYGLSTVLATFFFLFVILTAFLVIPVTKPVDWYPMSNTLNNVLTQNVNQSSDYRVSLSGRVSTRWFPFFDPTWQQTGGRAYELDQNIYYQSWYQSEVFFKDDLGSLDSVYLEDRPFKNVSVYLTEPDNFAEVNYWLDWFGTKNVFFLQKQYPLNNTINNYIQRPSIFSTLQEVTKYGPVEIVGTNYTSPVLMATNAKVVGFFSEQRDSTDQYNRLLALLSYLDLNSQYVIPIFLRSLSSIDSGLLDFILTDSYTYSLESSTFSKLSFDGINVVITSSSPEKIGFSPTVEKNGNGSLVWLPASLSQLVNLGRTGSYYLLASMPLLVQMVTINATSSSFFPPQNIAISPQSWAFASSENAAGFVQSNQEETMAAFLSENSSKPSSFIIRAGLPSILLLSNQLVLDLSVKTSETTRLRISFVSNSSGTNYVSNDEIINPGSWIKLRVPFTSFNIWGNPRFPFAMSNNILVNATTLGQNLGDIIELANTSITTPGYSVFQIGTPVAFSSNGFLSYSSTALANTTFIFSNQNNSYASSPEFLGSSGNLPIVPLREFTAGAGQVYTEAIVVSDTPSSFISISLFNQPQWYPVRYKWLTSQDLQIFDVPAGFKGLVWKETYSDNWRIAENPSLDVTWPAKYYFAGPGLVYIPLKSFRENTINISYLVYTMTNIASLAVGLATVVVVLLLRKRLAVSRSFKGDRSFELIRSTAT